MVFKTKSKPKICLTIDWWCSYFSVNWHCIYGAVKERRPSKLPPNCRMGPFFFVNNTTLSHHSQCVNTLNTPRDISPRNDRFHWRRDWQQMQANYYWLVTFQKNKKKKMFTWLGQCYHKIDDVLTCWNRCNWLNVCFFRGIIRLTSRVSFVFLLSCLILQIYFDWFWFWLCFFFFFFSFTMIVAWERYGYTTSFGLVSWYSGEFDLLEFLRWFSTLLPSY